MAINSDIRDQAYQFFAEEAPELLQGLETGLLSLSQNHSTANIHELMRAAHTIKGGAASVGMATIASLAHRLETIFQALYSDQVTIHPTLESQLLQAYDCLRLPLMEQLTSGSFDAEQALAAAAPVFDQIEAQLGDALNQTDRYIPSSAELGVDMVAEMMEVDVAEGLQRLAAILAAPDNYDVVVELQAQVEVFVGLAELFKLPGFEAIAETMHNALETRPDDYLEIAHLTLADFERSRQAILAGDRTQAVGPSEELVGLARATSAIPDGRTEVKTLDADSLHGAFPLLETLFGGDFSLTPPDWDEEALSIEEFSEADLAESMRLDPVSSQLVEGFFGQDLEELPQVDPLGALPIEELFDQELAEQPLLDPAESITADSATSLAELGQWVEPEPSAALAPEAELMPRSTFSREVNAAAPAALTIRVDSDRLEQMNNLIGELTINRDGLSLQNEQLQRVQRELLDRFSRFRQRVDRVQQISDRLSIAPAAFSYQKSNGMSQGPVKRTSTAAAGTARGAWEQTGTAIGASPLTAEFDALEMDRYGGLHTQLQEILEDMVQLEEAADDITLLVKQSNQTLDEQRYMLTTLRDEVIRARMSPLGDVLHQFPRILRDLSVTYQKPVNVKLTGTDILVDRAMLEKLHDPLLHLMRNAFDHGIELPNLRHQQGKSASGLIEIRAYRRGNRTLVEVKDDGRGLDLERIRNRVLELGWLSIEQLAALSAEQLIEFIFEPGFSTASQVSELSGRGMGLDVVRSYLRSIKGTVTVTSSPQQGTTFTLYLPLTLTISKLLIVLANSVALALPVDSIEEIITPDADQVQRSGHQRFLTWRDQSIPIYRLADQLDYACPLPAAPASKILAAAMPHPDSWSLPLLVFRQEQQMFALEVDRLIAEQELVIKPFSEAIAPPSYTCGCTILGDGSLLPVIDGNTLLSLGLEQTKGLSVGVDAFQQAAGQSPRAFKTVQAPMVLVVDDAVTLRRTLALSLERAGYQVWQARDGQEAISQLQEHPSIQLIICDIEMPNMNGFEFLSYRRQDPHLATLPIVMLTSRSNDKHRWLAMQLGATTYLTKPYLEPELLATLEALIPLAT
jgi:two-component system, chemotaxis family, sensor histidine kinase and response regulator PixL